ncbi:cytoplasmic protein [Amanita rubescens]|nr:cytoplasmic protein [Amanita rubescens]KAF8332551.1 cytoplasmic protein [Amanita rubescens]
MAEVLTSEVLPRTDATITVRVIKSFEYRTERNLVLHHINLEKTTVRELKDIVNRAIQSLPSWKAYLNVTLDTLKLYTKAHGAKTTNLIINLDHDDWILDDESDILAVVGFENETEVSYFNRTQYSAFKKNPRTKWDL